MAIESFAQEIVLENDSLILWNANRQLTWSDFTGEPIKAYGKVSGIHQAAASATGPIFVHRPDVDGNMIPYPLTYFYKNLSWTIAKDSLLLEHEQLHFDIKELCVRQMRKEFDSLKGEDYYDSKKYSEISARVLEECSQTQKKYDKEVSFNKIKQNEWKQFIHEEIEKLKQYEFKTPAPR